MIRLTREVRFLPSGDAATVSNTWAGNAPDADLRSFLVLRASVKGSVDQRTGYLCDIKELDSALRERVAPRLCERLPSGGLVFAQLCETLVEAMSDAAAGRIPPGGWESLTVCPSPFTRLSVFVQEPTMIHLTQAYEFSAAHRLFSAHLSDEENLRLFGKCSNPNGHGHNYVLEVTVAAGLDAICGRIVDVTALDRVVRERVIEPFDHKNLNVECPDFSELNPTVENIARTIWRKLRDAVSPARLTSVRVWETPKTSAECTGDE